MTTLSRRTATAVFAAVALVATPQMASAQVWGTWTSADPFGVYGTVGSASMSWIGGYNSWQPTGQTNYWIPSPAYTQNGLTAPTNTSFVQFVAPVRGTLSFSAPVVNPYIALISVGQPGIPVSYTFDAAFSVVSSNNTPNCAFWGCGTYSTSGNSLTGTEFSGTLQFIGTFTSISIFTTNPENWHGFTVGIQNVSTIPEPSTYALLAAGLAGVAIVARRRRVR